MEKKYSHLLAPCQSEVSDQSLSSGSNFMIVVHEEKKLIVFRECNSDSTFTI